MPISLQFYNTTSNPKKINKTLSAVGASISLAPFEDFDLENPYVIINNGVAVGNYAKIGNDYFFANEPILLPTEVPAASASPPSTSVIEPLMPCADGTICT